MSTQETKHRRMATVGNVAEGTEMLMKTCIITCGYDSIARTTSSDAVSPMCVRYQLRPLTRAPEVLYTYCLPLCVEDSEGNMNKVIY